MTSMVYILSFLTAITSKTAVIMTMVILFGQTPICPGRSWPGWAETPPKKQEDFFCSQLSKSVSKFPQVCTAPPPVSVGVTLRMTHSPVDTYTLSTPNDYPGRQQDMEATTPSGYSFTAWLPEVML